jgi:hypothetical protein
VSPYWLTSHKLAYGEYFNPGAAQSIQQTLSLSFVTVSSASKKGGAVDVTDIGFGIRTDLKAGHASAKLRGLLRDLAKSSIKNNLLFEIRDALPSATQEGVSLPEPVAKILGVSPSVFLQPELEPGDAEVLLKDLQTKVKGLYGDARDRMRQPIRAALEALAQLADPAATPATRAAARDRLNKLIRDLDDADVRAGLKNLLATVEADLQKNALAIQAEDRLRRGFILSVAGAVAGRVPKDAGLGDAALRRYGAWVTTAYRTDGPLIDFIALARVIGQKGDESSTLLDFGGRFVHQVGKYMWSAEYVERVVKEAGPNTERLAANFEYALRDNLHFTASFGKDFANPSSGSPKGGLISVLGLNFGLGPASTVEAGGK